MNYVIPKYTGVCDVQFNFDLYFKELINKTSSLFIWENLPPYINERYLTTTLLLQGAVCFAEVNSNLYAFSGKVGGLPNCYYEPSEFIVANPILGSHIFKIRDENGNQEDLDSLTGIYVGLTSLDQQSYYCRGLYNLFYQTAGLLADNISSLNAAQINSRISVAFTADTEALANTAEEVLQDIYAGKPYRVLSQDILNKIQVTPVAASGSNNTIMALIEAQAHIYGNFFSELGIGYQSNMKRERINSAEIGLMKGNLDLNVHNIIKTLQDGIEKVNKKFGTDISVDLNDEVFYVGSGNASLGEVNTDGELQVDGIEEPNIEQEEIEEKTKEEEAKADERD